MITGERLRLLGVMRGIAAGGVLLAAVTSEASVRSLVGILGVGLTLWLLDFWTASIPTTEDDAVCGRRFVALGLGLLLVAEAAGLAMSHFQSQDEGRLFYGSAVLLQLAALATTARCGPDDMSLVAWGSCHATIAFWAAVTFGSVAALTLAGFEGQITAVVNILIFWTNGLKFLFIAISMLLLMAALALGLLMEPARRRRAWNNLILTQAAVLVIFLRWPWMDR